jgi:hypothetical protein
VLIDRYKADSESAYNIWHKGRDVPMQAFRAIRRGVRDIVTAIAANTFGHGLMGSPLERGVLAAITQQKRVFEGADHPFCCRPKLRIPGIHESEANKKAFGQFLDPQSNDRLLPAPHAGARSRRRLRGRPWGGPCARLGLPICAGSNGLQGALDLPTMAGSKLDPR